MKKILIISLICILFLVSSFFNILNYNTYAFYLNTSFNRNSILNIVKGVISILLLRYLVGLNETSLEKEDEISFEPIVESRTLQGKVIVIDPGHGGQDPGAIGPSGLLEKDVALDISLYLYQLLKEKTEAKVYLTRKKDTFIPLEQRVALANNLEADLFLSIHNNGHENTSRRGIETFAHYNAPRQSWALAWYLHDSLVKNLHLPDRGLKADNFQVIRETKMKSILLEIAFITNYEEEALLKDKSFRLQAAQSIFQGLIKYYS